MTSPFFYLPSIYEGGSGSLTGSGYFLVLAAALSMPELLLGVQALCSVILHACVFGAVN